MKNQILDFLKILSETQSEMIDVLQRKQTQLVKPDKEVLDKISAEERQCVEKMQKIIGWREELLTAARLQNIAADSVVLLCERFFPHNFEVQNALHRIKDRTEQIRFLAFTNWTMGRKALVHISQMLEIIETHGQGNPVYQQTNQQPRQPNSKRGGFVDKVA
ncbi:hypothetical protein FACS189454_04830 [Planctomycetales bacterium]|nr:hypothetical protein FACS189454_04830 [Planctomycetales bacterium]